MAKVNLRDSVLAELTSKFPQGNVSDKVLRLLATVDAYAALTPTVGQNPSGQSITGSVEVDSDAEMADILLNNIDLED